MLRAPELLIAFRAACAPAIFVLACFGFSGRLLAAALLAAFVSDVLDGAIARRTGTATPSLRHADTIVDTAFYAAAGASVWVSVPGAFTGAGLAVVALIIAHVSRTTFEMTKYGRVAAYHMWSSKAMGVLLVCGMTRAFVTGRPTVLLTLGLWAGVVNELEGFAASAILPAWRPDVPSLWHARAGASTSAGSSSIASRSPS